MDVDWIVLFFSLVPIAALIPTPAGCNRDSRRFSQIETLINAESMLYFSKMETDKEYQDKYEICASKIPNKLICENLRLICENLRELF
jgi:hypothetical protein